MDIGDKKCYNNGKGEMRVPFEQLTLADDFMFFKVMQDANLCRQLLEVILKKPIKRLCMLRIRNLCKLRTMQNVFAWMYMSRTKNIRYTISKCRSAIRKNCRSVPGITILQLIRRS